MSSKTESGHEGPILVAGENVFFHFFTIFSFTIFFSFSLDWGVNENGKKTLLKTQKKWLTKTKNGRCKLSTTEY